jgi:hypothetical protein
MISASFHGAREVSFLSGPNEVKALQSALKDFSVQKSYPAADPGAIDGIVGVKTLSALASILSYIPKIPAAVKSALQIGIIAGMVQPSLLGPAKIAVETAAAEIAIAVRAFSVVGGAGGSGSITVKYPAGTIYAWSPSRMSYRIAIPPGTSLGATTTPWYMEVINAAAPPPGGVQVTESELETKTGQGSIFKKWWFWAAAGGVVVIGGTAYYFLRR